MAQRPLNALTDGHTIGRYRIGEVLGAGGFGITYRARRDDGQAVAIKEYMPGYIATRLREDGSVRPNSGALDAAFRSGIAQFLKEARILMRFQHPAIVAVTDVIETNGTAYYAMPFENGRDLSRRLAETATMTEAEVRAFLLPLLDGLEKIHEARVLHRDIKPSNVLLLPDGAPKLIDFGAAKQDFAARTLSFDKTVTHGYSPWEQYHNEGEQGPWTDLYALSATVYRCIGGIVPPRADERAHALLVKKPDPLIPFEHLAHGRCSRSLMVCIDACLRIREADRLKSVRALREMLTTLETRDERVRAGPAPQVAPKPPLLWPRRAAMFGGTAALAGIGAALAVPAIRRWRAERALAAGIAAFSAGDYATARENFAGPAEAGLAEAQYRLGVVLVRGLGGPRETVPAMLWLGRAAAQNHREARFELGLVHADGAGGVARDFAEARRFFTLAADQGHAEACLQLGTLYEHGQGVAPDPAQALVWYRRALERGVRDAQARIDALAPRRP